MLRSGEVNGLEVLLDAETFDNADPAAQLDGFNILIKNSYDASLVRTNHGFFSDPDLAVFLNADPDTAAFLMWIRIQIQLKQFRKKLSYEEFSAVEKKDCSKVK